MPPYSASISSPSSLALLSTQTRSPLSLFIFTPKTLIFTRTRIPDFPSPLFASRRSRDFINVFDFYSSICISTRFNFSTFVIGFQQGRDDFADDTRNWNRKIRPEFGFDEDYDGEEDEDDHEEEDRSLDLLLRFVENVFRKVSKRARKAVRSILPVSISTKLVSPRNSSITLMILSSI